MGQMDCPRPANLNADGMAVGRGRESTRPFPGSPYHAMVMLSSR